MLWHMLPSHPQSCGRVRDHHHAPRQLQGRRGEQAWNFVSNEDFNPNAEDQPTCDLVVPHEYQGRGGGGRKGQGQTAASEPRGQHSKGVVVSSS